MPADLEQIIAAARRDGGIRLTLHYRNHRVHEPDRPSHEEITFGLGSDAPEITRDDGGRNDPRGPVCSVTCEGPDGNRFVVRLNYAVRPMRVITAFQARREEQDG